MARKARTPVAFLGALALTLLLVGPVLAQGGGGGQTDYRQYFLDRLAAVLGIERSRLDEAARQAGDETLDRMQQDGVISQSQADWMRRFMDQQGWPGPWGFGHRPFGRGWGWGHGWFKGYAGEVLDAAAAALGITADQLAAELSQGKTIGQIADARGVDREQVRQAMVDAYRQRLDQAVANEDLTRKQADALLQRFQAADILDRPLWGGCRFKGGAAPGTSGATGTSL